MLDQFWNKEKVLIGFTGFVAALAALFLNVTPLNNDAKSELANIQVFWLLILIVSLTVLLVRLVKLIFHTEKAAGLKNDLPTGGYFSLTAGTVFFWIIINFLGYIMSSYPGPFMVIFFIVSGALVIGLFTWIEYSVHNHIEKFSLFSEFMVETFGLATAATYAVILTEAFFFQGKGLSSSGWVELGLFIFLFLLSLSISLKRGRNILISRAFQDMSIK